MSDVSYMNLLYKIGQRLSERDHQQLLQMCGLANQAGNIPDAHSLLQRLRDETDSRLEIDELGVLEEVLMNLHETSLWKELKAFEKKRKEYTNLLAKITDALDSDERIQLEQLKTICHEEETSLELDESISDIPAVFKELERRNKLGFRRLNLLKTILRRIEREDLVREIEEYEERRNENDVAEMREANSWRRDWTEVVTSVRLETVIRVGGDFLTFLNILSTFQSVGRLFRSFNNWFQSRFTDIELNDFSDGSICFTVQAKSLKGLTNLWERFKDGTLKESLYDFLVTHEVEKLAEAEEDVELTVTINEDEYERACIDLNNKAKGHAKVSKRKRTYSGSGISTTPNKVKTLQKEVKKKNDNVQVNISICP